MAPGLEGALEAQRGARHIRDCYPIERPDEMLCRLELNAGKMGKDAIELLERLKRILPHG